MDKKGFGEFLETQGVAVGDIEPAIALAERFERFLAERSPTAGDIAYAANLTAFANLMIADGANTQANFYTLARYARFLRNDALYVAVVEVLDGAEAMETLYQRTGEVAGEQRRDQIFADVTLPPLGLPNAEKVKITQVVMDRLVSQTSSPERQRIFSDSLRHLEDAWYQDDKQLYDTCRTADKAHPIDEFLDQSAQKFIAMLERFKDENQLFFTQPITDEVIAYVRSQPLIARGVLEGQTLYEVKIPHMTHKYLAETDARKKRYHYCHCPWVKEALRKGDAGIPPLFCECSAGFHKKRWEVILGQPLQAEIVESVLNGDPWCKIAIHLPEP
jgi:hypothetical protein